MSPEIGIAILLKIGAKIGIVGVVDIGIEIAEILHDQSYTSMYIKLVKEGDSQALLALAKDVSSRDGIDNKGAYFMKVLKEKKKEGRL